MLGLTESHSMQTKYHQAGLEMKPIEKERETKDQMVKVNGGGHEGGRFQLATAGKERLP